MKPGVPTAKSVLAMAATSEKTTDRLEPHDEAAPVVAWERKQISDGSWHGVSTVLWEEEAEVGRGMERSERRPVSA